MKDDGQILRTRCGTEEYTAPELLDGKTNYDKEVTNPESFLLHHITHSGGERPFNSTGSTGWFVKLRAGPDVIKGYK